MTRILLAISILIFSIRLFAAEIRADQVFDSSSTKVGASRDLVTEKLVTAPGTQVTFVPSERSTLQYGYGSKSLRSGKYQNDLDTEKLNISKLEGPGVGGGGDVKVTPDGQIELADSHEALVVLRSQSKRVDFKTDGRFSDLVKTEALMDAIAFIPGFKLPSVFNEKLNYYFVKTLPLDLELCHLGMTYRLKTNDVAQVTRAACTDGDDTYLVEDLFIRLPLKEQLTLLYHEDMRRYSIPNSLIARISNSLRSIIPILLEQGKGQFRPLTAEEKEFNRDLLLSLARVGLYDSDKVAPKLSIEGFLKSYRMTEYGGWVANEVSLTPNQKVGVFAFVSRFGLRADVDRAFSLVATNICGDRMHCALGENARVFNVYVFEASVSTGPNVTLSDTLVQGSHTFKWDCSTLVKANVGEWSSWLFEEGASVQKTRLHGNCGRVGAHAQLLSSTVGVGSGSGFGLVDVDDEARIKQSYLYVSANYKLQIGRESEIEDVDFDIRGTSDRFKDSLIPPRVVIKNVALRIENFGSVGNLFSGPFHNFRFAPGAHIEMPGTQKACAGRKLDLGQVNETIVLNSNSDVQNLCEKYVSKIAK